MSKTKIGYKYRIYPTKDQEDLFARSFGHARYVWNMVLDQVMLEYEAYKLNPSNPRPFINQNSITYYLPPLKKLNPWLYEVSSDVLLQKLRDLAVAFRNYFGKGDLKNNFPNYKKKHGRQSFRLMASSDGFNFRNGRLYIAKCRDVPLKVRWSRELPSMPSSCTISRDPSGKYYVSFVCERNFKVTNGSMIKGLDLGLKHYLVDSDGVRYENPKHYRSLEQKLKRLQRSLSRRIRGSKRYLKLRTRIAILHEKISNLRKDYIHKLTRALVNENQVIGVEGLNVAGMIRNKKLSKSIMDAGWGLFNQFLEYKVRESGHCILVRADAFFPSTHLCSACSTKLDYKLKLNDRTWTCSCGVVHDRDQNAAINLKKLAMRTVDHLKPIPGDVVVASYLDC